MTNSKLERAMKASGGHRNVVGEIDADLDSQGKTAKTLERNRKS